MEHFLCSSSSLLLHFLLSFILFASQIPLASSNQAYYNYSNVTCIESECRALLQFKDGLIDESNRLSSWIGERCCSWEGVDCHNITGSVLKLDLRNTVPIYEDGHYCKNCLGGQLSPSLINLTNLRYLDLSLNNFSRIQIPTFFGLFKGLRYLNLSSAELAGEIPYHLGNCSHLQYLDLGVATQNSYITQNWLRSKDLGWLAGLSSLEGLVLSWVDLSAAEDGLKAIKMLSSLTTLKLDYCKLFIIPHLSPANFTSLSTLDLSGNNFSNYMVPSWLHNLTLLHDLRLSSNNLSVPIHGLFGQMTSLALLDLGYNRFEVSTLKSLCNVSNLTYLDMNNNNLQGSIPSEIGQLISLTYLDLSYNDWQGSIPSEIGQLVKLTELLLFSSRLNGTIPYSLGQLMKLQTLDISYNSLTGVLSEHHFSKLKCLKKLDLSENSFSLNVSSSWVPPFQLQYIGMRSIKLGPRFPEWLRMQQEVEQLYINNASISDAIPSWFRVLCYDIKYLDLSNNNITGSPLEFKEMKSHHGEDRAILLSSNKMEGSLKSFPSDIWYLDLSQNFLTGHIPKPDANQTVVRMIYLRLNNNHFRGTIPEDLCRLKSLAELELSNNHLSGRVPMCLGNLRELWILNLANNRLYGQIPSSLGNLKGLNSLLLNGNKFVGKLPSSMQNLTGLQLLDLGENRLKDIIPSWIGERFSKLMFLRLQSNNFHGGISNKLCQISNLQVLNLAHNNLTGNIPQCFNNFTVMASSDPGKYHQGINNEISLQNFKGGRELEYSSENVMFVKSISLSANNLVGEIPDGIMDLTGLKILNLSQNHLSGRISKKIANLKQLETLDLSMNELFGAIPPSLSALDSLSFLNLSYNNLSGQIPSGNQLQTLMDPSIYEGNSGLCGKPLPNNCLQHKLPMEKGPILDGKGHNESDWSWFYAGIGPGFAAGLLGVLGILIFKVSWRYAYFRFLENAYDKICVMIALKTAHLRRNFL
ncbi:receptor-like protein EIX2 [Coffea eugenioides]|uniref:receptor-like protein EIX2 n=1 Tax=Coffea eugenioides TaxID=49369 RepID=UPI000F609B58|nr:receptor-like protein EIX2 [Coffea eugenioides]